MSARLGDIASHREDFGVLPIGTGVVCADGYWKGRRYVKTGDIRWALVFHTDWRGQVDAAVREQQNNVSPCPTGRYRVVLLPRAIKTRGEGL